ncbi:SAM-dependent methyltransferase [Halarchaeum grantii]|uniref:SAM-dependent methyltransferase n=1 Tax=Halarchaeum grantii TaxID=1193105 RepID=A0A830EWF6_9EURY|nr:tRNA (adenine-N1)-methyltransferase [Halarchaeum grantii]GGL31533.1 SAM-dependent methyltransferase [Halarchaeum grantii]
MSAILLVRDGREFLVHPGEELHTDLGVVEVPADPEPGETVESHLGEAFTVRTLRGPDLFDHLERTGAPMIPKDIGVVIGHTGAATADRVLDAGTGTGVLAAYLGRLGADVLTFESRAEFAEVARENMALADVDDTVEVRAGDITEELDGLGAFDLVTLDTPDAPEVVARIDEHLVPGGYVAVYSPFVENARASHEAAADAGLLDVETVETIQRRMDFDERGSRPTTKGVGHTGYLTFARQA